MLAARSGPSFTGPLRLIYNQQKKSDRYNNQYQRDCHSKPAAKSAAGLRRHDCLSAIAARAALACVMSGGVGADIAVRTFNAKRHSGSFPGDFKESARFNIAAQFLVEQITARR